MTKSVESVVGSLRRTEVEAFVTRFLTSMGAEVKSIGDPPARYIHARLPKDVARALETDRTLRLCFSPTHSKAEYVTFGHPLLDRMVSMARQRGQASNLIFSFSIAPDFVRGVMALNPFDSINQYSGECGPLDELIKKARSVQIDEGHIRIVGRKISHQRQLLFFFRVSMISDEKREESLPLLIDPLTETVDRPVDVSQAVSFRMHGPSGPTESEEYSVERLYRVACHHLEQRLKGRMARFEHEAAQRADTEKRRIEEYYRGLAAENLEPLRNLFRRISAAGMRAELARTWRTESRIQEEVESLKHEARSMEEVYRAEMKILDEERAHRLLEVDEKYRARVEIALTHAAYVMVPRIEWQLRMETKQNRREMDLVYDVLRRTFVNWQCEHCEERLVGPGYLCSCEALVCSYCHVACASCGQSHCPLCTDEPCHMCGRVTCATCDSTCPAGVSVNGLGYSEESGEVVADEQVLKVCHSCRVQWCDTCQSASFFHPASWHR